MICFRLRRGEDLRGALMAYAKTHAIQAAVPVACVGCVSRWRIRCADGQTVYEADVPAEIVSLTGTLSQHGCHLHIALAQESLTVIGGHLLEGCIINTTAEVVLLKVPQTVFRRTYDAQTAYDELDIQREP